MASPSPDEAPNRAGRRRGNPDTKAAIVDAAKNEFAVKGYDGATMRGIARLAGVDAALVHHYFGSKDDLLLTALEVPFDPRRLIPEVAAGGPQGLGRRIAQTFLTTWDEPASRVALVALLRTSLASRAASGLLRDGVMAMILPPITSAIGTEDASLRAQLVASQLVGLGVTRYVLQVEPLASTAASVLADRVAPTLQGYIDGLPAAP